MSAKRTCRVCGCTEDNGCVTLSGRCHWVEADLCSACLERAANKSALTAMDVLRLQELPAFVVEIDGVAALQILSALQLALRHPGFPPHTMESVRNFAALLQVELAVTENLELLCQAGWNPAQDVPVESREAGKIIVPETSGTGL